jgi:hypothetical protein
MIRRDGIRTMDDLTLVRGVARDLESCALVNGALTESRSVPNHVPDFKGRAGLSSSRLAPFIWNPAPGDIYGAVVCGGWGR